MISLTLPRAKPSTSRAGQPPAAIPHTQSPASTHAAAVFSPFFPVALAWLPTHITPASPLTQSFPAISATVGATQSP